MTISTNDSWELNRQQIIDLALADVGAIGPGGTPSDLQRAHAASRLNLVATSLEADGAPLWRTSRKEQTLTASTASYTLDASVLDIEAPANYRESAAATERSQVLPMTREAYMAISDRTVEGTPAAYYLEKLLAAAVMYLYPVPDTTDAILEYAAVLRGRDFDSGAVTADFPRRWLRCLVLGLDLDLSATYSVPAERVAFFAAAFEAEKAKVLNDDVQRGPIQIVPFGLYGGYNG